MKKIYIGTGSFLAMIFVWAHRAMAESVMDKINANLDKFQSKTGLGTEQEPEKVINWLLATLLGFLGIIFLVLIIYGGFLWMTAKGNDEQINKAKKIIMSSSIGLTIIMGAYIITMVVFELIEAAQKT